MHYLSVKKIRNNNTLSPLRKLKYLMQLLGQHTKLGCLAQKIMKKFFSVATLATIIAAGLMTLVPSASAQIGGCTKTGKTKIIYGVRHYLLCDRNGVCNYYSNGLDCRP